jgi:CHASE2 domain-containing sensor protein
MLVRFIVLSAIGAGLFVFHGIAFHLTPWSQTIINGIVKHIYPPDHQEDMTVVLFREENLRQFKEPYPVSYERHAEVLEALSTHAPRAVFVDFAFIDPRPPKEVKRLCEAICSLDHATPRTAVYLATVPGVESPGRRAQPKRNTCEVSPGATAVRSQPRAGQAVLIDPEPVLLTCAIPVTAEMESAYGISGVLTYNDSGNTSLGLLSSPAFAMLPDDLKSIPRAPMEIIWGNRSARLNQWMEDCELKGWRARLEELFHALRHQPLERKRTCPYTPSISVAHLLGSSRDEHIAKALSGKTIFYGAGFQMAGDRVVSPVYHDLPAVFLHAMAYDNLLTYREDYKRARRDEVVASGSGRWMVISGSVMSVLVDAVLLFATVGMLLWERVLKWFAGALGAFLLFIALLIPTSQKYAALAVLLGLGALPFFLIAARPPHDVEAGREFLGRVSKGLIICAVAALAFLVVDVTAGLETAMVAVFLPAFFVYKAVVAKDVLFVKAATLLVVLSIVSFSPPLNLGPRNIVAYLLFFEVARHLLEHGHKIAVKYFKLREDPKAGEWGWSPRWLGAWDWMFAMCVGNERKEERHGKRTRASTSA